MNLLDLVSRNTTPLPWADGEGLPWRDPGFSARMLQEHLSQEHDFASRRFEIIDRQVAWIHDQVLRGKPARILDLACGPGFYTARLARYGHACLGIDYAPASIAYAAENAELEGLQCSYMLDDIRLSEYGNDFDLVMLLYGEFNVFQEEDARLLLRKAHSALKPGGFLLLEPHTFAGLRRMGKEASGWYSKPTGLFSEEPHLVLIENTWEEIGRVTMRRYFVVKARDGEVNPYTQTYQAYTQDDYEALLDDCGFDQLKLYPGLGEINPAGGTGVLCEAEGLQAGDLCAILSVRSREENFKGRRRTLQFDGEDLIDN
jgi:SAM-dependent methyltransferase